eukprot:1146027-Alexandrium_andersonii.AAC.1
MSASLVGSEMCIRDSAWTALGGAAQATKLTKIHGITLIVMLCALGAGEAVGCQWPRAAPGRGRGCGRRGRGLRVRSPG